jgi:hypothetical protein
MDLAHARLHGDGLRDSVRAVTRSSKPASTSIAARSRLPVALAVAGALAVGSWAGTARAQAATQAAKEDVTTLERSLAEQHDALSTSDCATACRALASIRRAADKICALDPGDRCLAGRAKADDATRRVREACPECAIATAPPSEPRREDRAMTKGGTTQKAPKASEDAAASAASPGSISTVQSAPPSESKRGGCAGCTTTPAGSGDLAGGALAIAALALVASRRRSRAKRASRP